MHEHRPSLCLLACVSSWEWELDTGFKCTVFQCPGCDGRRYIQRRAKEGFHQAASVSNPAAAGGLIKQAKEELEVVKRQALVYSLYARKYKNVLVSWALGPELPPGSCTWQGRGKLRLGCGRGGGAGCQ